MSSPPDRSWMLATPIGSSAQALEPNIPAAAVTAVPCKNFLRLTFIAVFLLVVAEMSSDQIFFQNRSAHGVFRIDHVSEPNASGLTEKHVSVDLIEPVIRAHPSHEFAIGDPCRVFQRPGAADRHEKLFGLKPRPRKTPVLVDVDLQRDGGALFDRDPRQLAVALRRMAIADVEKAAFGMHRKIKDRTRR